MQSRVREYQKKDRKIWIKFFTMHRKLGYRVILIAQMDKMLDKQIRGVIEYEYVHRKLSNFGKTGKILTFLTGGETFTAVQMWYPLKLKIGSSFFRAKKKYYSLYDSYAIFGDKKTLPAPDEAASEQPSKTTAAAAPLLDGDQTDAAPAPELSDSEEAKLKWQEVILDKLRIPAGLFSFGGKYLRPGGRDNSGWTSIRRKQI